MPTTILESFRKLKQNLEITGLQETTVSTRQTTIRKVVEADLAVVDSFLTGSYSRSTIIAPLKEADIDIFIQLDAKYFHHYNQGLNGGQAGLLDLVKRTLKKTYTRTPDISRNGHAVSIRFEDFVVDVVPGFKSQGDGYLIPDTVAKTWLSTDPKKHVEIMSAQNAAHNGDLVPLIKMVKGWNVSIGKYFRSFHLEVLALQILNNVTISDFPSGVRYYFDKGRTVIKEKNLDPAGFGDDLGKYINNQQKVQEAVAKFELAYDRAIKAEDYARRGYIQNAVEMWVKVFGDYFPAYG
jgi:hypothetical protein